jgi:excisionase family DNA binding protein
MNKVLRKTEAAAMLGVSLPTINRLLQEGKLPKVQITARRVGIQLIAIETFLRQQTVVVGGLCHGE